MTNTIAFIFASASEKNPTRVLSDYDKKIGPAQDASAFMTKRSGFMIKKSGNLKVIMK